MVNILPEVIFNDIWFVRVSALLGTFAMERWNKLFTTMLLYDAPVAARLYSGFQFGTWASGNFYIFVYFPW